MPDPAGFRADIDLIPQSLDALADARDHGSIWPIAAIPRRLLLIGMGSSHFAAEWWQADVSDQ